MQENIASPKEWAVEELKQDLARMSGAILPIEEWAAEPEMDYEKLEEKHFLLELNENI